MRTKTLWLAAVMAASVPLSEGFAADTGGKTCPSGQTWSDSQKKCIPANHEQQIDQEATDQGRALAKAGNYTEAIALLSTIEQPADSAPPSDRMPSISGWAKSRLVTAS